MEAIRNSHKRFGGRDFGGIENLGLRLDKLNENLDVDSEHENKDRMIGMMTGFKMPAALKKSYSYAFHQWRNVQRNRSNVLDFDIKSSTKLLLGSGNASVHELGVSLNRPWGVPFIPGTALKGLASSYLAKHGDETWWKSRDNAVKSDCQVELFGGDRQSNDKSYTGSVVFNDAWLYPDNPASGDKWFIEDIINAHSPKYFSETRLPDGTESPNPIKIAALKPELRFFVALEGPSEQVAFVKNILGRALEEEGIGGKTSVGYGRFSIVLTREEEDAEVLEKIETAGPHELLQLSRQSCKTKSSVTKAVKKRVSALDLDNELLPLYERYAPLKIVLVLIKENKVASFKALKNIYKNRVKNHLNNFKKNNPHTVLSKEPDAQEIFRYALNELNLTADEIQENGLLKQLAYRWEDVALTDEKLIEIPEDSQWVWPPIDDLKAYLQAGIPDGCTEEGVTMAMELLEELLEGK